VIQGWIAIADNYPVGYRVVINEVDSKFDYPRASQALTLELTKLVGISFKRKYRALILELHVSRPFSVNDFSVIVFICGECFYDV
jgi:hypothetical protein